MKLDKTTSPNVIDKRHVAGALAGVLATIIGFFGVRAATHEKDPDQDLVYLVSTALDRGQAYWQDHTSGYHPAKVVLFERSTSSGCGRALSESGPFYCPADERIYLDLAFLRAIDGDLSRAYVLAHELGHHVQHLRAQTGGSIDIELGADCLAGAWMHDEQQRGHLEGSDFAGALQEASAVGDDRICPTCSSETWTHGSSSQRLEALAGGFARAECF